MSAESSTPTVPKQYLLPFILTTCCFSLWGFANDFTNPLVKVFEQVFVITTGQASWLQFAFYFILAISVWHCRPCFSFASSLTKLRF